MCQILISNFFSQKQVLQNCNVAWVALHSNIKSLLSTYIYFFYKIFKMLMCFLQIDFYSKSQPNKIKLWYI